LNIANGKNVIITSILKTAKMPITGSIVQRRQAEKQAVEKFYTLIQKESVANGEIKIEVFKNFFKKVFPGIKIKLTILKEYYARGAVEIHTNKKMQVDAYNFILKSPKRGVLKLDADSVDTIMHEAEHVAKDVYNPKYPASKYEFKRSARAENSFFTNLRNERYENIYANFLYNCEINAKDSASFYEKFNKGGKIKTGAIKKRILEAKNNYTASMSINNLLVEDEKIKIIKAHIRSLESEQKAYDVGVHYGSKHGYNEILNNTLEMYNMKNYFTKLKHFQPKLYKKTLKDFCKKVDLRPPGYQKKIAVNENHIEYLFPEKIKMLKELFFEEVQKSRKAHRLALGITD